MSKFLNPIFIMAFLILLSFVPAFAQVGINQVQGNYINSDLGFSIMLPRGWQGTELSGATFVVPGNWIDSVTKPEATIVIAGLDKSQFEKMPYITSEFSLKINVTESLNLLEKQIPKMSGDYFSSSDCKDISSNDTYINGAISFVTERECTGTNFSMKMKAYFVESGDKLISLVYLASPSVNYEKYLADFDSSVSTLKIISASSTYEMMGLRTNDYSLVIGGKTVDLQIYSNSTISNFLVSKPNKQVSFTVEGSDGTSGIVVVPIGRVMQGPFVVQFDGQNIADFKTINDSATGETSIEIRYHHSSHQIIITGTQVVPEFSVIVLVFPIAVMASIMLNITMKKKLY